MAPVLVEFELFGLYCIQLLNEVGNFFDHQLLGSLYLMELKAELIFLHFQCGQILEAHLSDILQEEPF